MSYRSQVCFLPEFWNSLGPGVSHRFLHPCPHFLDYNAHFSLVGNPAFNSLRKPLRGLSVAIHREPLSHGRRTSHSSVLLVVSTANRYQCARCFFATREQVAHHYSRCSK